MSDAVLKRVEDAMRARRRDLIAKPLEQIWPDLARAAVEAMMEPSSDVMTAMTEARDSGRMTVKQEWQAAIHAALAEGSD